MLFYVSYWLLSKMEVAKWNRFVKGKVQDALDQRLGARPRVGGVPRGVPRGLRDGAVLQGAVRRRRRLGRMPVVLGIAGRLGRPGGASTSRSTASGCGIPLKPFFGVTSAFLYYMAFVFAGKGIAELQEGGLIGTTIVPWAPRIPALGHLSHGRVAGAAGPCCSCCSPSLPWSGPS